ncbi:MAG: hypothetical protein LQ338_006110 [Usnochroma carphineum]|nr:MAG: hypothetical protein LQ338_006110 [Usnochroma carphineum]
MPGGSPTSSPIHSARTHYDTPTIDAFYQQIWGGEDLHNGIYDSPNDTIFDASQRTGAKMADIVTSTGFAISAEKRILDLGAGYGGSARWLAKTYGCRVTCVNLSPVQNERNRAMNKQAGLDNRIDVVEGNFEELPPEIKEQDPYDIVWSQDAFLHSANREKIVEEIDKVLVPKDGRVVFTDIMASHDAFTKQPELMKAMMARLDLSSLGTIESYKSAFVDRGFKDLRYWDGVENFSIQYRKVNEELQRKRNEMQRLDETVIEKQAVGMRKWLKAAEEGCVDWGIFCFGR